MAVESTTLRTQFPDADASLFGDFDQFDTPEQLRAAVEDSHASAQTAKAALRTEVEAEVQARYEERYGPLAPVAPADGGGGTPTGLPSAESVARMTMDQRDALDEQHGPGTVRQILRSE